MRERDNYVFEVVEDPDLSFGGSAAEFMVRSTIKENMRGSSPHIFVLSFHRLKQTHSQVGRPVILRRVPLKHSVKNTSE